MSFEPYTISFDLMVEFLVVDIPVAYNAIIGRPLIYDAQVVVSTYHLTNDLYIERWKAQKTKGKSRVGKGLLLNNSQVLGSQTTDKDSAIGKKKKKGEKQS